MERKINRIIKEKERFEKLKEKIEKDKIKEQEYKDKYIQSQKDILYDLFLKSKLNIEEYTEKIQTINKNKIISEPKEEINKE